MESKIDRKEAIRKFKERKTPRGVFAIRCRTAGSVWVGSARDVEAARNREWFTLRHGKHMNKALQAEWNLHGEAAFEYEILEVLDEDALPIAVPDLLKEKSKAWAERLGAGSV